MRLANASNAAKAFGATCLAVGVSISTNILLAPAVSAQEVKGSSVRVLICPDATESNMAITSPASDSVTDIGSLEVAGTADWISQIDVYVDDRYNNTFALDAGANTYRTKVELSAGTHTIRLHAYDSCAQTTHEDSIVVTFIPRAVPADGLNAETAVTEPSMIQRAVGESSDVPSASVDSIPLVPEFIENLIAPYEADSEVFSDGKGFLMQVARTTAVIVGLISVAIPSAIAAAFAAVSVLLADKPGYSPWKKLQILLLLPFLYPNMPKPRSKIKPKSKAQLVQRLHKLTNIIRISGIVIILLAFLV